MQVRIIVKGLFECALQLSARTRRAAFYRLRLADRQNSNNNWQVEKIVYDHFFCKQKQRETRKRPLSSDVAVASNAWVGELSAVYWIDGVV